MCLVPLEQMAQEFPADQWHKGEATLNDGTIVSGTINYDLERNAIIVNVGERMETYSAQLVMKFSFIQEGDERLRRFFTLPYLSSKGNKTVPMFFEVIVEGKMTLMAREYIDQITTGTGRSRYNNNYGKYNNYNDYPYNRPYVRRFLSYKMFFLDHKGKMTAHTGKKKDVYAVLNESKADLKKFVKTNRLKIDKLADVAKLVNHYNTLI
jgi:hypothetical protein